LHPEETPGYNNITKFLCGGEPLVAR